MNRFGVLRNDLFGDAQLRASKDLWKAAHSIDEHSADREVSLALPRTNVPDFFEVVQISGDWLRPVRSRNLLRGSMKLGADEKLSFRASGILTGKGVSALAAVSPLEILHLEENTALYDMDMEPVVSLNKLHAVFLEQAFTQVGDKTFGILARLASLKALSAAGMPNLFARVDGEQGGFPNLEELKDGRVTFGINTYCISRMSGV